MTCLHVVAIGARTPIGRNAETSAASLRARISRYREFPFINRSGGLLVTASDADLQPELEGRERLLPMLDSVLEEIQGQLARALVHLRRILVFLALPEVRPGFSEQDAWWVLEALRPMLERRGFGSHCELAGRGHAGVIAAIEEAWQEKQRGAETLFLILGADTYHHADTFIWLEEERRFAQPAVRNGFTPGEGVCALALCPSGLRSHLGLHSLALVKGAKTARESRLRDSDTGSFGEGMCEAIMGAVHGPANPPQAMDILYTDINGERYRSEEWGFVALKTPGLWKTLVYEAPSDCVGDIGAAFGAFAGILAVQSYRRGYAIGPRAMVLAGSDSGLRGAMVLEHPAFSS